MKTAYCKKFRAAPPRGAGARRSVTGVCTNGTDIPYALTQAATEGLIALDRAGRIVWGNRAAARMFGLSTGARGISLARLVPAIPAMAVDGITPAAWLRRSSATNTPIETVGRTRSGAEFRIEMRVQTARGPGAVAFIAVIRDVTRQRRLENRMRSLRTHFRQIVETAAEAIVSTDDRGRIVLFNPAARALFGYAAKDVLGKPLDILIPARFRKRHTAHLAAFATTAEATRLMGERGRIVGLKRDGSEFPAEASISRFALAGRTMFNVVLRDRTAADRAIEALRAAQAQAEIGVRVKTAFLANVSHELRTPLNAVIGFADLILSQPLGKIPPEKYRDYARDIQQGGRHLLEIIDNILEMSRIEAGCRDLVETEVDVRALIDRCIRTMRGAAAAGGVTVLRAGEPVPCRLQADEAMLRKTLLHLLSNAIKFTPVSGKVVVSASCAGDRGFGITVSDSGFGIAAAHISGILQPFNQVDDALTRRFGGMGLGLPLAKSLVELHGGSLVIESQPGQGTAVTALFPPYRCIDGHAPS